MNKIETKNPIPIDQDFALWAAEQGALLRAGRFDRIDIENVAEEIESLARSDKYEIDSRMEVLLQHLLKWQFQPSRRTNSWKASIVEQRMRIGRLVAESPSLKSYPTVHLSGSFVIARGAAIDETGLPESVFPETCPYTIEQILDPAFLPD